MKSLLNKQLRLSACTTAAKSPEKLIDPWRWEKKHYYQCTYLSLQIGDPRVCSIINVNMCDG